MHSSCYSGMLLIQQQICMQNAVDPTALLTQKCCAVRGRESGQRNLAAKTGHGAQVFVETCRNAVDVTALLTQKCCAAFSEGREHAGMLLIQQQIACRSAVLHAGACRKPPFLVESGAGEHATHPETALCMAKPSARGLLGKKRDPRRPVRGGRARAGVEEGLEREWAAQQEQCSVFERRGGRKRAGRRRRQRGRGGKGRSPVRITGRGSSGGARRLLLGVAVDDLAVANG